MKIEVQTETIKFTDLDLNGYMVTFHQMDNLVGQVLTLIETVGLPEKQEKSLKDVLKQTVRKGLQEHDHCFITNETFTLLSNFNKELHEKCIKEPYEGAVGSGWSYRDGVYKLTFESK